MEKILEFNGLRFKTSFKFKNKKEECKYFNNSLIESIYKYQREQKKYYFEKLHILISYKTLCKLSAFLMFIPIIFLINNHISFLFIGISILLFLVSNKFMFSKEVFDKLLGLI